LINFSSPPLRVIALFGIALGLIALALAASVFFQYVTDWTIMGYNPRQARGWTSLILVVLFLGSIQLFSLGVIGEYIGKLFTEAKGRPVYVAAQRINFTDL
jgi:polyisoprenyl-phosphate glycosyltransferase